MSEGAWVVLEQGERFSPNQFLAFPFDSDQDNCSHSTSSDEHHNLGAFNGMRTQTTPFRVTPGFSLRNAAEGVSDASLPTGLKPSMSLNMNSASVAAGLESSNHRRRMLDVDKALKLMNLDKSTNRGSSVDSLSSNEPSNPEERESAELLSIWRTRSTELKYNGRDPPFIGRSRSLSAKTVAGCSLPRPMQNLEDPFYSSKAMFHSENVTGAPFFVLKRPKSANGSKMQRFLSEFRSMQLKAGEVTSETVPQLVGDDINTKDFVALLKSKQKERIEWEKQKKVKAKQLSAFQNRQRQNSYKAHFDSPIDWVLGQLSILFTLARKYAVPMAMSHLVAVILGVYLGRCSKTPSSASVAPATSKIV